MPSYKLSYFDAYGRGEMARLLFAAAKVEYEDERFSFEEWKASYKQTTPFGYCPVLYIDGAPLCESGAIMRYLAVEFGFNGANSLQGAYIEMISGALSDMFSKLPFFEKDEKLKEEKSRAAYKDHILPLLVKMEKKFTERKCDFLIGDKTSYADIKLMQCFIMAQRYDASLLTPFPNLVALKERVAEIDGLKQYLAERNQCPF